MISRPLTDLLKKNVPFQWITNAETTFQTLKQQNGCCSSPGSSKLCQAICQIDASDIGIGAVLMQDQHPVAYLSKALGPKNQGLSVYEKECMDILLAVDRWRSYLQHQPFIIRTDHRSLQHLTEKRVATKLQHKALLKLMDLQYTIQYKKGSTNGAADAYPDVPKTHLKSKPFLSVCPHGFRS